MNPNTAIILLVACGILLIICTVYIHFSVSSVKKSVALFICILSLFFSVGILMSLGDTPRARKVLKVTDLQQGIYELQDVWKADNKVYYATIRPAEILEKDWTNRTLRISTQTSYWVICDVTSTKLAGKDGFESPEYSFSGVVQVFKVDGKMWMERYEPWKGGPPAD